MSKISMPELYRIEDAPQITEDIHSNLFQLHFELNFIRSIYKKPMIIDRGFSTPAEQIEIYKTKGQVPRMGSFHLIGGAADISDPQGDLKKWCLDHLQFLEGRNYFFEEFDSTVGWVHLQIYPYSSWEPGKSIFFIP